MGICCIVSEQLRLDLAESARVEIDDVEAATCMAHVMILKQRGDGRSAFNMLLHYEIEHPDWFGVNGICNKMAIAKLEANDGMQRSLADYEGSR